MKELLQQIRSELEKAYTNPESNDLGQSIRQLQDAKEQYGDKGTMIEDVIRSLSQAKHSEQALENAGDIPSAGAFGQAYNALQHAIESYSNTNNDPF
ncbi:hypothetical protein [Bacillus sp. ISL-39]|uniref:hypothetical protein n=1 Tax=Bacillus sp. ISL-39 TaxID=2819124 RepID=UPI001BE4E258|nr:hypothetical protein [Bacillus sp. ISL-39]MBT2637892.1 hypothetical protein [Bacillus sp. ISL-39]